MNDSVASVPPAITVPTGATAGSFTVASSVPAEDTRVSLLASVAGRSLQTAFNVWRSVDNEVWYEIIPDGSAAHFTLANAGLIEDRRDGRFIWYRPDVAAMNGLIGYLTENCCRASGGEACATTCAPAACKPTSARKRSK